ncbi:50S ribosomal protein L2 [Patescibacteria group bacterium]|nr:50S ribosomal protein L2 [Patescibacteria group bacterium]
MKIKKSKKLLKLNPKNSGRNNSGKITVRHQGGRQKRFLRTIDWKRNQLDIPAKVASIEYDPNRTANIALLFYANGLKNYILAPKNLKVGDTIISSQSTDIKPGNSCHLINIPVGTPIHNLEIMPGKGAQMVRSAGNHAQVQSKEEDKILVKLPSGEIRAFKPNCRVTIGSLSNPEHKHRKLGKAGTKRLMGIRPTVRGVAQHPGSHPHGGGEGRSGIGMSSPKSPWGKKTLGKKTRRKKKYSNKLIIKSRHQKRR